VIPDARLQPKAVETVVAADRRRPAPAPSTPADVPSRRAPLLVGAGAFVAIGSVSGADGAYFPSAWGWCALLLAWAATLALSLRRGVWVGPLELAALGGLALLTVWTALSIAWSADAPGSVLALQRMLVYLTGLLAVVVAVRRRSLPSLLGGLLAGIAVVCAFGLGTRLFPGQGAATDVILQNRLADPIGYWNALGLFAAMGALLALGFVAHGAARLGRVAAAAVLPVLMTTLYFTYSRGAWIALAIGLVAAIAVDPRRLRLVTALLLLAPLSAAAVLASARSDALTGLKASHDLIAHDGHRVALLLVALTAASAAVALVTSFGTDRLLASRGVRRAYGAALAVLVVAALGVVFARYGDPVSLTRDGYRSFADQSPAPASAGATNDLNKRLFTLHGYGRVDFWKAAWRENRTHPLRGAGAGSFEQYWLRHRTFPSQVRDAHSLYAQTLAELGLVGLLLLVLVLAPPLVAGVAARGHPLVPGALGGFVAYLAHTGVDWDWQMPAVTLIALALAGAMLVASRGVRRPPLRLAFGARVAIVAALVCVGAFSAYGLVGNRALARATDAADNAHWREAERAAHTAIRWAPWSGAAWQDLGNAQVGLGERARAQASLRKATRLDPSDWRIWFDLGTASSGRARRSAYRHAATLNPLAEDIRTLRDLGYRLPRPPRGAQ
jgi:hypothetical protein